MGERYIDAGGNIPVRSWKGDPTDKVTVLMRAIRDALKIVGDPASGHKMMSSRREAQAVHRILNRALADSNGEGQTP